MGILSKIKDDVTSFTGATILKKTIERYGTMLDFKIDSEDKKIYFKVALKGEQEPLEIIIHQYSLIKKDNNDYIIFNDISISKEWLQLLASDLLKNKELKLPEGISTTIAKLVL